MAASYPNPPVLYPSAPSRPVSAGTARSLVLAAMTLQSIFAALVLGGAIALAVQSVLHPFPNSWAAILGVGLWGGGILVLVYLTYVLSYLRIGRGEFAPAQAPTLVIGIVSLFVGLIPGILEIVGYVKIGDAIREQQTYAPGATLPPGAGFPMIACKSCGRVYAMSQFAFCPACGQKLGPST